MFVQDCFSSSKETFTRRDDGAGNVHVCGSGAKVRSRFLVSETIILVLHFPDYEWASFIAKWGLKVPVYSILKHQLANAPTYASNHVFERGSWLSQKGALGEPS